MLKNLEKSYRLDEAKNLLRKDWKKLNKDSPHSTGFCYIAAEACYHLLGGAKAGLKVFYAAYVEDGMKCTHWWLCDKEGKIVDPTASQYTEVGLSPPYHLGKGSGFLTRQPSKRAAELMKLIKAFRS